MALQIVTVTIPHPSERVDLQAARLAAKRTLDEAATDAHGTRVRSFGAGASLTETVVEVEVEVD